MAPNEIKTFDSFEELVALLTLKVKARPYNL
jgi:hypothetical protein